MNIKTTITLVILALVVVGFFLAFREWQTTDEKDKILSENPKNGELVFKDDKLDASKINWITIKQPAPGGATGEVRLELNGSDWFETKPVRYPLDSYTAGELARGVAEMRETSQVKPGKDTLTLEQAGLGDQATVVAFEAVKGEDEAKKDETKKDDAKKPAVKPVTVTHTIKVGKRTGSGKSYVQVDNDTNIRVVDDALYRSAVDKTVNDLRRKELDVPIAGAAERVSITRAGQSLELEKHDGSWAFAGSHSGRVDGEKVKELLSQVGLIRIGKFTSDAASDLASYGLDHPSAMFTVVATDPSDFASTQPAGKPRALRIGNPTDFSKENFYATWSATAEPSSVIFEITKTDVEKLAKQPADLRDARVTPVKVEEVRELTASTPAGVQYKLTKSAGGTWSFDNPKPDFKLDAGEAAALVDAIGAAKAKGYIEDVAASTQPGSDSKDKTLRTITMGISGRPELEVLRLIPSTQPAEYAVVRNSETVGYVVPAAALERVMAPAVGLRDKMVLTDTNAYLKEVTVAHKGGPTYVFTRDETDAQAMTRPAATHPADEAASRPARAPHQWQLVGRDKFEDEAFELMIRRLLPLRARAWVTTTQPASFTDTITMKFATSQPATHVLRIDPAARLATLDNGPTFSLEKAVVDTTAVELYDRKVIPLARNQIKSVARTQKGQTVTIEQDASGKYTAAGAATDKPLNEQAVGSLFDELAGLRVDRFVAAPPWAVGNAPVLETTLIVTTTDGKTYTLSLDENISDFHKVAKLNDQWFTLTDAQWKRLVAELFNESAGT